MKTEKLVAALMFIGIVMLLAGCSGLHVQWVATATYNMPKPADK